MNAKSAVPTLTDFINDTSLPSDAIIKAREEAQEYGLYVPDNMTGDFFATIGQLTLDQPNVVIVSPAAGVISLEIAAQNPGAHVFTGITPEVAHQNLAKQAFILGEIPSKNYRLIPGGIDILERLAANSYGLAILDVELNHIIPAVEAALPLLKKGGALLILDALLDGTIGDPARTDPQTLAARQADEYIRTLGLTTARLPLGSGLTLITT